MPEATGETAESLTPNEAGQSGDRPARPFLAEHCGLLEHAGRTECRLELRGIAAEDLVTTMAGEGDFHVMGRQSRRGPVGESRRISHWHVLVPHERRIHRDEIVRSGEILAMMRVQMS